MKFIAYNPVRRLPYVWISVGSKQYGLSGDTGEPALFSERYGYRKVRRALGYKFITQDRTANSCRFVFGWYWPWRVHFDIGPAVTKENSTP